MKTTEIILTTVLIVFIVGAMFIMLYMMWGMMPTESIELREYKQNISLSTPSKSSQFYLNMRYRSNEIAYSISENCSDIKKQNIENAFQILEQKTTLKFFPSNKPEITISCTRLAPEADDKKYFIAGEGGPSEIINATRFSVILSGKIAIFRDEKCDTPQVALHEILHALGFDHNKNESSIMYQITDCDQVVDSYIIDEINQLYGYPSQGDLILEKIRANRTRRLLNFEVVVSNSGLQPIETSNLAIYSNNDLIDNFDLGRFPIGLRKNFSVQNLRIPSNAETIEFIIETPSQELDKENNKASIRTTLAP